MTLDSSNEESLDLRALDPDLDAESAERFVSAVMGSVASRGARPATPTDPLYGLWTLPRPFLLAASFVALVGLGAGLILHRPSDTAPATVADALGVPPIFLATGARRP